MSDRTEQHRGAQSAPEPPGPGSRRLALLLALLATLCVGVALQVTDATRRIENDTIDVRHRLRETPPPPQVLVVGIDSNSFSALGERWPWPRWLHARAVRALTRAGAKTIVYDVQFTEQSENLDADWALFRAIQDSRRTVLATTEVGTDGSTLVLGGDDNVREAHAMAGAANFSADAGGVLRRVPYSVGGLKSLAVAAVETTTGQPVDPAQFGEGEALIDFVGPPGRITTVSFVDLIEGRVPGRLLRGRIVVVGATAPSLQDMHATPTAGHAPMPGPEVQANAILSVLNGLPLRSSPDWFALIAVVAMAMIAPLLALRLKLQIALGVALLAAAAYVLAAVWAFERGLIIPIVVPILTLVTGMATSTLARYLGETRQRRRYAWYSAVLEREVAARTAEVREAQLEIVERLGQAADWREAEIGRHIERVGRLCEALALDVGYEAHEADTIRLAAALHDIGKIGIPDSVLLKEGALSRDEWNVMRGHTTIGGDILAGSSAPLVRYAEEIARSHHEHWDGNGYPSGLAGKEIPRAARICAICDVFDALLSKRSYKEAWPLLSVIEEMRGLSGKQFDPDLLAAFIGIAPRMFETLDYGEAPRVRDTSPSTVAPRR
ncbi:MAG: CHASE2 domain-containing protein [Thermoleophilia bacterium]|nr:CHASE2 domain-containing protein [Thermoleophilia bacterium]